MRRRALGAARRPGARDRGPRDHDGGGPDRPRRAGRRGAGLARDREAALRGWARGGRPFAAATGRRAARPAGRGALRVRRPARRCSAACRSASAAARSSRSRDGTAAARRRSRRSPRGCSSPTAGSLTRNGRATYLSQDPGRYLVRETAIEEVALGVGGDERAGRGRARAVRAHVRDVPPSAGSLERRARAARHRRRLRLRSPTCSSSTSRPAGSTRTARRRSRRGCSSRRRAGAASSSPRTIRSCPHTGASGSTQPLEVPVAV